MTRTIRIATRASQLALWQAHYVADLIRQTEPGREVELVHVTTTGDRVQSEVLRQLGSLGVFTREVQHTVLEQRADVAVHSLKDLPTEPTPGLVLAGVPERAVPFDALVLPASSSGSPPLETGSEDQTAAPLEWLPPGARVGTGSLRRQAQLRHPRPDLVLEECRGNVDTRLRKLDAGQYDALILAAAGLTRLGWRDRISQELRPPLMYPAVSQGAIGIECRAEDAEVIAVLNCLTDPTTSAAVLAERSLLATLRAGCHAPLGVHTERAGETLSLEAVVLSPDGRQRLIASARAAVNDAVALGAEVAHRLHAQGASDLIEAARFEK